MVIISILSLGLNVYFVVGFTTMHNKETEDLQDEKTENSMVGSWIDGDREIQIREDGTVFWITWDVVGNISHARKGYIDGDSLIFTQSYKKSAVDKGYTSVEDIDEIQYDDSNGLYSIVMYGEDAFGLNDTDRATRFTFVRESRT